MMYKTHIEVAKATAITTIACLSLIGNIGNNLIVNYSEIPKFLVSSAIIYYTVCWGSTYPDTDLKTSAASRFNFINRIIATYHSRLHLHHRSIKTHSIDLCAIRCSVLYLILIVLIIILKYLLVYNFTAVLLLDILQDFSFLSALGLFIGNVCHIFADFFTQEGAYIFNFMPLFRLVPSNFSVLGKKPFKDYFSTGDDSPWEKTFRKVAKSYYKLSLYVVPVLVLLPIETLISYIIKI